MTWSLPQRLVAEFVGTFGLLVSVTGAALLSLPFLPGISTIDVLTRVLLISIAIGTGLIGVIYAFGDISGAHFNPAVTIGMWAAGRFPSRDVIPYVLAQVFGGVVGVASIAGVAYGATAFWTPASSSSAAQASQAYSGNGSPYLISAGSVFLLEVVLTFFLVHVILFATRSESSSKNLAPIGIGLTLLMINLVAIPVDGASVNPARSFAPAILSSYFSADQWAIQQNWLFWVAPIVGGLLAAALDRWLRNRPEPTPA